MSSLLETTETFATRLLQEALDPRFLYHDLAHTRRVVESTKEMLEPYGIEGKDRQALLLAAWLHDTGYTQGREAHEEKGSRIAEAFLQQQGLDPESVAQICQLILATERYHQPTNLLEEIIRDADASHLGQEIYPEVSELLKQELAQMDVAHYTPQAWRDIQIEVFRSEHRFYTSYAREHWGPGKERNLQNLLKG
jgi:predicted metal-dependent HD superfamily phosphohydrolase